jgi:hypothetical protein
MGRKKIMLDDLSGWAREQVERKIGINRAGTQGAGKDGSSCAPAPAEGRKAAIRSAVRVPNKTEADYNRRHLSGAGLYEAVTLRLPGGSRYTPDFMTVDQDGRVTFHEVKGSYRLHSPGRAMTAFRECAAAFAMFGWVWAARQKDGTYQIDIIKTANGMEV